jgi:hypothetical protein
MYVCVLCIHTYSVCLAGWHREGRVNADQRRLGVVDVSTEHLDTRVGILGDRVNLCLCVAAAVHHLLPLVKQGHLVEIKPRVDPLVVQLATYHNRFPLYRETGRVNNIMCNISCYKPHGKRSLTSRTQLTHSTLARPVALAEKRREVRAACRPAARLRRGTEHSL